MNTNAKNKRLITSVPALVLALVVAIALMLATLAPGAAFAKGADVRETIDSQMTFTLQKASYTPDSASNTSPATYNTNTETTEATTQAAATNQNASTNQTPTQTSSSPSTGDAIPFAVLGLLALAAGAAYCLRESKKLSARGALPNVCSDAQSRTTSSSAAQSRISNAGTKLSAARAARTSNARAIHTHSAAASRKKMLTVVIAAALIFATCFGVFTCKTLAIAQTVGQKITNISEVTINEAGDVLNTKITVTNDSTKTVSLEKIVPPKDLSAWSYDFGDKAEIAPGEKIVGTWTGETVTTDYVTQADEAEDNTFTIFTLKTVVKYDNEVTTDANGNATTLEPDGTDNCAEFNFVVTDGDENPISGATVSIDANAKTTVTLPEGSEGKTVELKMTDAKGDVVTGKKVEAVESSGTSRGETTTIDGSAIWRVLDATNATVADATYTGDALTPKVTIPGFTEGTDFEIVEWSNNTDAGQASVKVKGIGTCTGVATINFTIKPATVDTSALKVAEGTYIYNGTAQTPAVTGIPEGLVAGTDYDIIYANNTNAGKASATITFKGNYEGTADTKWTIAALDISNAALEISTNPKDATYTGSKVEATVDKITLSGVTFQAGDWEVDKDTSTLEGSDAGEYSITVKAGTSGNCTGKTSGMWSIRTNPLTVSDVTVTGFTYDGAEHSVEPVVVFNDTTLKKGVDYEVSGDTSATDVKVEGYKLTVTGKGNYSGTVDKNWSVQPLDITGATPTITQTNTTYTGSVIDATITGVTLKDGKTITLAASDFSVTSGSVSGTNAGTYNVVIEGSGNYTGCSTGTWKINPATVDTSALKVAEGTYTYTGTAQTPNVIGIPAGLALGPDYDIIYDNNTNTGKASATITFKGNYEGSKELNFTIAPYDISNSSLSFANSGTVYTGSVIEAGTATVTLDVPLAGGTETISQGTDFTISSSSTLSATNAGTYTATAKGKGNFTGECSGTWTIAQADLPDSDIAAVKTAIGTPEVYVGTKLSTVTLPTLTDGTLAWSSEYTSEETVGDVAATVERNAVYTPADTNYKPATIAVKINVKKTYTVVYHSNGGTLEGATFDATNAEYTYSEEIDLDSTTLSLTANKFTNEGNTFAYWTLGKSDTNVVADNATTTTLTYVDGHSLADGNGMYTNTSTSSSKTKAAVGATVDLYAHWADDSIGDYWMAAAGATLPDAIDGIVMTQTQVATEIASSGTTGASTTLKGYMDSDASGGNPGTGTHLYTRWNEDKALPMADRYTEFRIVQVGEHLNITDDNTSGDGSNVTFMAVHSLPTAQQANANNTNVGGWGSSDLRGHMDTYVAANMASDFTSALKTVTKKAYSGSNDNWISDSTTNDKIWLMSYSELTGATRKTAGFEGTQYAWFSSKVTNLDLDGTNAAIANLHKTRSGSSPESLYDERVWMRSPQLDIWGHFWVVYSDGNPNWLYNTANRGSVCVALCM